MCSILIITACSRSEFDEGTKIGLARANPIRLRSFGERNRGWMEGVAGGIFVAG